jgi:hypothetical protein
MEDLQVFCFEGLHTTFSLSIALPGLILWGFGIPAVVWFLMNREKERFTTLAVQQKFGFLYKGYKKDNFFWEIVIMYRKVMCIFIATILNRVGLVVQALLLLILLAFFL